MEGWLVADRAALRKHYKRGLDESKLPLPEYAETTAKERVYDALSKATKDTPAGSYGKIRDAAKILALADPIVVRRHCRWCERLFVTMANAMGTTV
jgi:hypothetical protein